MDKEMARKRHRETEIGEGINRRREIDRGRKIDR